MSRRRWLGLAVVSAAGAIVALGVPRELVRGGLVADDATANFVTVPTAVMLAAATIGALTARRNARVGVLLAAGGLGGGIGYWRYSTHPWPAVVGFGVAGATALLPLHAAVSQGGGMPRWSRRVLVATEVALAGLTAVTIATAAPFTLDRWFVAIDWRRAVVNHLLVTDAPSVARATHAAWWVVLCVAGLAATGVRWLTWRREPAAARRRELPALLAAGGWSLCVTGAAASLLIDRLPDARQPVADWALVVVPALGVAIVTIAIAWCELIAPQLGRVRDGRVDIGSIRPEDDDALRRVLADLLGTTAVDVVFARGEHWVDTAGRDVTLPDDTSRLTLVQRGGARVAAIVHEPDVSFEAIDLAARITAAHLDSQRATALARANAEALRAATGRLVRAGDQAAVSVANELEAGPLPALGTTAESLRSGTALLDTLPAELQAITADVRRISHGVFPRDIDDDGLPGVLPGALDPPRRLPRATEITVYLLAHQGGAAVIDDQGNRIVVRSGSAPEAELAARVRALGGEVEGTVTTVPVEFGDDDPPEGDPDREAGHT